MEVRTATADAEVQWAALRPRLLRCALALGCEPDGADDLVQDTLLSAHRQLGRFDATRGTLEGWAAGILVGLLRHRRRAFWRRSRLLQALRLDPPAPARAPAEVVEARVMLEQLLTSLGTRQREVVALYEIAGLDADETARALGITAAGVRSIARDARRRLAELVRAKETS